MAGFEQVYVPQQLCQRTHEDAKELCAQKHKSIDEKLDSVASWLKGLVAVVVGEILVIGVYTILAAVKQ